MLCGLIAAWGKERAIDYLKRLAAQDPIPGRGNTQRTQLVAAGEFALLLAYTHSIEWMKSQGAPIDWLNLEPVVIEVSTSMLAQRASHPNAGKLLVDFMLSREGQSLFKSFRRVTLRTDVEPDPPRLIKGFKRVVLRPENIGDARAAFTAYRNILGLN